MNTVPLSVRIKDFLKAAFYQNREIKLFALLISLGLFTAVRTQEKIDRWIDVEVNVLAPPVDAGLALTTRPAESIRVHVRGRPSRVNSLRADATLMVTMDLRHRTEPGAFTYFFDGDMLELHDVEVLDIRPEGVPIRLEKVVSATVPVRLRVIGSFSDNLVLSRPPEILPDTVEVRGAASLVRSLGFIETEAVDVSELTAGNIDLAVQLAFVEGVSFKREGYRVRFELERAMVQRVFDAIPVTGDPRNPNLRFSATTVNVVLSGPEDVLAALEPAHIVARVNTESALRTGRGRRIEFPILVDELPARVELISIEPAMVATVP